MRYSIALIIGACLGFQSTFVAAQGISNSPQSGYYPQDLPRALEPEALPPAIPAPTDELLPFAEPLDGQDELEPFTPGAGSRQLYCEPALLESSGTWLERGFWYAQADVLILNRTWERKGLLLASDSGFHVGTGQFNIIAGNDLNIDGDKPGADMALRLTLGRFLFRDSENRDHTTEFTWFGDGHWSQAGNVTAAPGRTLEVFNAIDRFNISFDGANESQFLYDSHLDSFEVNYHVKQRMGRDRMEMQPSGVWVRKATNTFTLSYLAGLRYLNHREALDWSATGIPDGAAGTVDGNYFITTDNNLLGTQLGGSVSYDADRWSMELLAKMGGYWNAMDVNSTFNVGTLATGQSNADEDNLSAVAEVALTGRWHLRPNLSIRAGMELLWVESVALAPFQLNFIPDANLPIVESGDSVYMGTTIGLEGHW